MATLKKSQDGSTTWVPAHMVIGRGPSCGLRIEDPSVSQQHASLRWRGDRWELRDLGSRNGTWVDGARLEAGGVFALTQGSRLRFGPSAQEFEVVDVEPPEVFAVSEGMRVVGEGGLLSLPDGDNPSCQIYADRVGQWVCDQADGILPLAQRATVTTGETTWVVHLPRAIAGTWEPADTASLAHGELRFTVSQDEEDVHLSVLHPRGVIEIESRAHHYMLLTLARLRLADHERAPDHRAEHGWIEVTELARMLAVDTEHLRVMIHRARRQLAGAGVQGAAGLIERRVGSRSLRLGVSRITVTRTAT